LERLLRKSGRWRTLRTKENGMIRTALTITIFAGLLAPVEALGQRNADPDARGWGNVSAGWGSMTCDECGVGETGFSVGFAWGLTINESFLVALSINAVSADFRREGTACLFPVGCGETTSSGRDVVVTIGPIVRFYPFPARGAFVRGGIGLGITGIDDPDVLFDFGFHKGVGATFGLGWDVALGSSSMAVTPSVIGGWVGASGQKSKFVQAVLGITFH
jgi:hypothetical protein